MARRKPVFTVEITEGAIRVRRGEHILTITPCAAPPDAEHTSDFVIALDDIEHWDAPHDNDEITIEALQVILNAIEEECDRHGLSVAFD